MHMNRFAIPLTHTHSLYFPHLLQPHLPLLRLQPKLTQPNPGNDTHQDQHARHNDSPMLNMRQIQIIRRPRGRANRRKTQCRDDITRHAMILVDTLRVVHTAVQLRHIVLCEPHNRLDVYENVKSKAKTCVCGFKVFVAGACLVHLDDDEAGCEGRGAHDVEEEVGEGARALLFGRVRRLEDEGCLDG
jgi:hypothetical protein